MKKRTLKKLVATMVLVVLFSSTVAYGATSYYYDFTMYQAQSNYTDFVTKKTTTTYAKVEQSSLDSVLEYTVVDSLYAARSATITISGADTVNITYNSTVDKGDVIGLKIYNDPADNYGGIRAAEGRWTP